MGFILDRSSVCAVVGHGSWATALVKILSENERQVVWYVSNPSVREGIERSGRNPKYLRDVRFVKDRLRVVDNLDEAVRAAQVVVVAVPSAFLASVLAPLSVSLDDRFVVSAVKGIVPGEWLTPAEYVKKHCGVPFARIGILGGPCHAEEVAQERLSYLTLACKEAENAALLADKFATSYIRVNTSADIYGVEYAAVLKNIYAIAVGMAVGLGYGDNFRAVLISNCAMEMARFLEGTYPAPRDTNASAFLGDLLVTAYSQFSRNRALGLMIGKGYSVRSAQMELGMVAEGYYASESIRHVNASAAIDLPIADMVHAVLYEGLVPKDAMRMLTEKLI